MTDISPYWLWVLLVPFGEAIASFVGLVIMTVVAMDKLEPRQEEDKDLRFTWYGIARRSNGQRVLDDERGSLIGAIVLLLIAVLTIAWKVVQ